jgi:monofunctional glycosyltransferase
MSPGRLAFRWAWRALVLVLGAVVAIQLWFVAHIAYWKFQNPGTTAFMQRELDRLRVRDPKAVLHQQWVPYERISVHLKRAVIAAEDARFIEHDGVDWDALKKAYEENLRRGRTARGGSTISQQLAKNLFLSSEKSYMRKAQEFVITAMLEFAWDKRRILEVYLNVAEWGDGTFGVEAAARQYYGVAAAQVGAEQAARMAAFLPNPKRYGRLRTGPFLDQRTEHILRYMPVSQVP